jgi:ABC-type antimicrobial peptide transport system permease subunit
MEIIGVSRDARGEDLRGPVERRFYMPFAQTSQQSTAVVMFIVRTVGDPTHINDAVRKSIADFSPNLVVIWVRTMNTLVDGSLSTAILIARLCGFFGLLALLLACIGLYGVMTYSVNGRTREIGVRMAMGAPRALVLWMVLRETLVLTALGLAIGIPAALVASRLLRSMLFGLSPADPGSLLLVCLVLCAVASLAGFIPARRAASVDPLIALRYE